MWGLADAAHLVVAMCEHSKCANETVQKRLYLKMESARVAVPTSAWLLGKLKSMRPFTMEKRCDAMLHYTAAEAVGRQLCSLQRSHKAPCCRTPGSQDFQISKKKVNFFLVCLLLGFVTSNFGKPCFSKTPLLNSILRKSPSSSNFFTAQLLSNS